MGSHVEKFIGRDVMAEPPTVSVIIPAYNVAEFIAETLDSVAAQTFRDFEVILINDGSPDTEELERVIQKYLPSIVYLKNDHAGLAATRNVGIEHARGTYLAFLDGDDIWLPEYLQSQIEFLKSTGLDLVYADALLFGSDIRPENYMTNAPSVGEVSVTSLIEAKCNLLVSGTVVRKQAVVDVGGFDEVLPSPCPEDFDLWVRLLKSGVSASYQRKVLLKYRVSVTSMSGTAVARIERMIKALEVLSEKIALTDNERQTLERRLRVGRRNLHLERAKTSLVEKDYIATRNALDAAWGEEPSFKLRTVRMLCLLFPKAVRSAYKVLRPAHYDFIRQGIDHPEKTA
jgi:GT2 family glycosyltransferase